METANEIRIYLEKSDTELYQEIGRELAKDDIGALPQTPEQLSARGQKWISHNLKEIKKTICSNQQVKLLVEKAEIFTVIEAVIDLLTQITLSISPLPVAVLVVRYGLKKMCENFEGWEFQVKSVE